MVSTFSIASALGLFACSLNAASAAEVQAKSLVLPGQANAGATLSASAEIRVIGTLGGTTIHLDVILTGDAVVDGTDPILGSADVASDGIHTIAVTFPHATDPGAQLVALRARPLAGEIDRTDNIVFADPVTIFAPHVVFASTAPLLFQATEFDPDLAADIAITNDGTAGSFGFFDLTLSQHVTWLELSPNSGVAVGGGAPGIASVLIHPQGLQAGTYETTIDLTSSSNAHSVQHLPVKLVIGAPWFTPGDRVRTTLLPGAARELRFETLAGMQLKVATLALDATPKKGARVELLVRTALYDPLAPISLPVKTLKSKKQKAVFKTPTSGTYVLRLTNPGATAVTVEIQTGRKLPKAAGPQVATLREPAPSTTVLLLPGATLDAAFDANGYVTGPIEVAAECALGVVTGIGQYVVLDTADAIALSGLVVPAGPFVTLAAGGYGTHKKAKIKVVLTPHQPALGTSLVILS